MWRIVDQLDPIVIEERVVREEQDRWPGWETRVGPIPGAYHERLMAEWSLADYIVVNSEWSRLSVVTAGVSPERVKVVPLAYEPEASGDSSTKPLKDGRLSVLWLGQVNLRKGFPYLLEAARLLPSVDFSVVGRSKLAPISVRDLPSNVSMVGEVDRATALRFYRNADAFVLPTLSDGFAITQLEAMSYGLPVITTDRCGRVVDHGVDGFVVPPRDGRALAEALQSLAVDRGLLRQMSVAAVLKSRQFTLDRLAGELARLLPGPTGSAEEGCVGVTAGSLPEQLNRLT
jgi:glycosyltransferase involved in cell wall biosynthesis